MKILNHLKRFVRGEEATTAVEYAIMLALIIMVCIVGVGVFGGSAGNMFTKIETTMP